MVVNTSPIIGDQPNRHMPFQPWSILIIILLGDMYPYEHRLSGNYSNFTKNC